MLLAGDVGGTKTALAVYEPGRNIGEPLAEATFPSNGFASLEAVVRAFLTTYNYPIEYASFGVAGPVVAGRAEVTNLLWEMSETELQSALGLRAVKLLNDLESIAYAVPHMLPTDLHAINTGVAIEGGAIAVIAPGTGLGEAFLTSENGRYRAHPSEGGHASFAPNDPQQRELLRYLQERIGHVSCERVCSGLGIPNIYAFVRDSGIAEEPAWLAEQLAAARDHTPVIVKTALNPTRPCAICITTLRLFVSILGAEAGNLALKVLSTGGVYIGGGIPPRILPVLQQHDFMNAFLNKGRFAEMLQRMPVHIILNPKAALIGAASYGLSAWH
ncbi:MAG: glucokinase [Chloroflexi bacterium SZAS-1]|nr:glucokinase [Chloroflexi bacterium SZAS-1]